MADYPSGTSCCDLHGRNCEPPSELCCRECTEARHCGWADERGRQRFGHPAGEECSVPDLSPLRLPDSAGAFLHNMLGVAGPEPGPPYVHTFAPGVTALKRSPWWYRFWRWLTCRQPLGCPPPSYTMATAGGDD